MITINSGSEFIMLEIIRDKSLTERDLTDISDMLYYDGKYQQALSVLNRIEDPGSQTLNDLGIITYYGVGRSYENYLYAKSCIEKAIEKSKDSDKDRTLFQKHLLNLHKSEALRQFEVNWPNDRQILESIEETFFSDENTRQEYQTRIVELIRIKIKQLFEEDRVKNRKLCIELEQRMEAIIGPESTDNIIYNDRIDSAERIAKTDLDGAIEILSKLSKTLVQTKSNILLSELLIKKARELDSMLPSARDFNQIREVLFKARVLCVPEAQSEYMEVCYREAKRLFVKGQFKESLHVLKFVENEKASRYMHSGPDDIWRLRNKVEEAMRESEEMEEIEIEDEMINELYITEDDH